MNRRLAWTVAGSLLWAAAAWGQAETTYAPRLACPEPRWEFGVQVNTQTLEHVFVLRNEGNASLEIQGVRPTCGCTVANLSANSIPPGGEATLTTRLDLRGRTGAQMKHIRLQSNDPDQANYTLTLSGEAAAEVQLRPANLFFGRLTTGGGATGAVEVVLHTPEPVRVLEAVPEVGGLVADLETVEEAKLYRVTIRTEGPLSVGHFLGRVNVLTDHPGAYARLQIPVNFIVAGGLTVAPAEIVLPADSDAPLTRHVVLHSPENAAFEILGVELPPADIRSSIVPMGQSGYRIQLDNIRATPEIDGKEVHIRTSAAEMPLVSIPFRLQASNP